MRLIAGNVCRKWLWNRCRGRGVASCSRDQYDKLCLQRVNVDTSAKSSIFSAASAPGAAHASTTDMM